MFQGEMVTGCNIPKADCSCVGLCWSFYKRVMLGLYCLRKYKARNIVLQFIPRFCQGINLHLVVAIRSTIQEYFFVQRFWRNISGEIRGALAIPEGDASMQQTSMQSCDLKGITFRIREMTSETDTFRDTIGLLSFCRFFGWMLILTLSESDRAWMFVCTLGVLHPRRFHVLLRCQRVDPRWFMSGLVIAPSKMVLDGCA